MELNADFSRRVVVHAAKLAWTASPTAGVERRMLDRIGEEVARATSIVRYAPRSRFSAHTHGGGEEFLVLDGVFQDEHGDFPAGFYVPDDRTQVRLDSAGMTYIAVPERPGVELMPLFQDRRESVRLERWTPNAEIVLPAPGGMELLVLEGGFSEDGESFERHSWLRLPSGATFRARVGAGGCRVWVKTGHLAHGQTVPAAA
jgi:anti-sigma factor ChrR (cupin superfamily)